MHQVDALVPSEGPSEAERREGGLHYVLRDLCIEVLTAWQRPLFARAAGYDAEGV